MRRTYTIPAKPTTDDGHLELIARILFVIGFKYEIVEERWPRIRKAFKGFRVREVARMEPEKLLAADGMIRNRRKIQAVIANAQECARIVDEHGSMRTWVKEVVKTHEKDPLFTPSLADECRRRFAGIGATTKEWLGYVFADGKAKPERRVVDE